MFTLMQVEIRKMLTSPVWWIVAAAMLGVCGALAALLTGAGVAMERSPLEFTSMRDVGAVMNVAGGFAFVISVVLGILTVTADRSDRTLALTVLAGRGRTRVYVAKVLVCALFAFVLAVATLALSAAVVVGVLAVSGIPVALTDPEILGRLGGGVAVLTLWALIGAGLGALMRHQLAAIVAVLVFTQAVDPVVRSIAPGVGQYLPGAIAEVAGGGSVIGLALGSGDMSQAVALGIMVALTAVVVALGALRYRSVPV